MRVKALAAVAAAVALLIGFAYASRHADSPVEVVTTAPTAIDFAATDLDGSPFSGASLRGKVVLLDFWAVWCAPCITAIPKLNHLQAEFADYDFEVVGLAVHSGTVEDVRQFAAEHGMRYRVVVGDEELPYRYGVIGYPSYFLIDRQGNQVRKLVGALPDLEEKVIAEIKALVASSGS